MASPITRYADIIEQALRQQQRLPYRSDQYADDTVCLDLAADDLGLTELDTPNWQIVFGRRGTGKTHLLRTFAEINNRNFNKKKNLCIYMSASDFVIADDRENDLRKTSAYFQIFLDLLTSRLLDTFSRLLQDAHFLSVFIRNITRVKDRMESLVLELRELANEGTVVSAFGERKEQYETHEKSTSDRDFHAGLKLSGEVAAKGLEPKLGFEAKGGVGGKREVENTHKIDRRPVRALRVDLVRSKLVELIDVAKIDCLYILIDEWPQLDQSASTAVQPEFADVLRRCLGNVKQISVKIASNRYQTRLSYHHPTRGKVGLELSADIFEAINLDHALLAETELKDFYETLIFKRLSLAEPAVKAQFGAFKNGGAPRDLETAPLAKLKPVLGFIEQIFSDEQSFIELVKGCEGIPREFIVLFNAASFKAGYDIRKRWTKAQMQAVIRDKRVAAQAEDIDYNDPAYLLLNKHIRAIVLKTRVRMVGFRIADVSVDSLIDRLLEKRILHEFPKTRVPTRLREDFEFYIVDYGYCLDWVRAFGPKTSADAADEIGDFAFADGADVEALIVEIAKLESTVVTCPHCKTKFSTEARAYASKKLCPECFEPVEPDEPPPKPKASPKPRAKPAAAKPPAAKEPPRRRAPKDKSP